jgi:hypothetical protein
MRRNNDELVAIDLLDHLVGARHKAREMYSNEWRFAREHDRLKLTGRDVVGAPADRRFCHCDFCRGSSLGFT